MKRILNIRCCCLLLFAVIAGGCSRSTDTTEDKSVRKDNRVARLSKMKDAVVPFFKPMSVQKGDWLTSFKDSGQTFDEYIDSKPTLPTAERKTIYIQPVGTFTPAQKEVLNQAAEYMRAFYKLPVKLNAVKPLGAVPKDLTRTVFPNNVQIQTSYFLTGMLPKMLPKDAAALICFTNSDLFPDESMSFVFGQASLENRVGVWSLWRFSPKNEKPDRRLLLSRTLKIAMHETGHMFSMRHCTKYECLMSGTNSLTETDRRPLDVCPECMAKIAWAMDYDPAERYKNLAAFWKKQGLPDESNSFSDRAAAVAAAVK